ncbi:LacI family DNA-binding transcriptional regulator [Microbacterium thalassium]|uniref:DNA-binding LacI/PurR family transcriptional regulator n=1 Tax=Microbacterium thalassium TaxID=362649 RepID=A0A7X0FP64_9MICO|nr:LacI family DNA-binding transcriptional regulator [Microbacterium thalassium]MBB6390562.1 DNA-binding LacI/PurR family transcriptional regulator [Microbacterium thalassium]GLK25673.1 LacI family transcriptional regulator [Microbacterium thalassium]
MTNGNAGEAARPHAPNIRDVAAAAGVSYQTVSRVLNDAANVSDETRTRVLETIAAMDYRPSRAARSLNYGRVGAVTVVTADTQLYGHASTLRGIEESARAAGHTVGITVVESDAQPHVRRVVEQLSDPSSGAVVVIGFDPASFAVLAGIPADVPVVVVAEPGHVGIGRPSLSLDEHAAAAAATTYLLDLGHRTVHHVAIPAEQPGVGRQSGWREALEAADAPVPEVVPAGWSLQDGYEAGRMLAARDDVTAVFCGNDDIALGVRRAMYDAGRQIPAQVSIVGFDDIPATEFWTPALTTVHMDFVALGRAAHAMADALTRGGEAVAPQLPVPSLVVRESTAPPRRG